jgi:tetratricopeptide (TPR) repeat protein
MPDVAATAPFPTALVGGSTTSYVGRTELLDALTAQWKRAAAGSAGAVLLAGEPGVGKTRTAAELAHRAHDDGARVLYGGCDEGLGAPYQPFVEALRWYTGGDHIGPLGRLPGELTRLFRDLPKRVDGLPAPVSSDPGAEEHRLFEAVTSWLIDAARANGLLLVLDDVHWATKPTLLLILHVLRAAAEENARLLVVVTYRDTEVDRAHPLSRVLGDLRQLPGVERAPVDNLTESEVVALIEASAGHAMDADGVALGAAVYAETEGNPFFVAEVLRHLVETGAISETGDRWTAAAADTFTIPEGVREVVGRRLSRLSVVTNEVLTVAAVQGREVDLDVLDAVSDASEDQVLDALDEARAARLIEETGIGRYRFAHALVRATLYEELLATRRRRLHRRIAAVLEKLRPADVVALAYHYAVGGTEGDDTERAVEYGLAAAEQSLAVRAFADAEDRFRVVLDLIGEGDSTARVAALCGLGECQRDQGNPEFRETLLDASRRAVALAETGLLVRAVLANSRGMAGFVGELDTERIAVIEATLDAIGPQPSVDRARLLAQLSAEITYGDDDARRIALCDESEAMARQLGDDAVLAWVLARTGYAAILPSRSAQLVVRGAEGTRLADATGDPSLRVFARIFESGALLLAGRIEEAFAVSDDVVALADAECSPSTRWLAYLNSMPATFAREGAVAASRRNDECLAMGQDAGEADALQWWGAAASAVFWLVGEGGDVADTAGMFAAQYPLFRAWVTGHAWMLCEGGRHDEARAIVEAHGLRFVTLEDSNLPLTATQQLASLAWELEDPELARSLIPVLEKYAGCWAHYFLAPVGPVVWTLGAILSVVGEYDRAFLLLDEALQTLLDAGFRDHAAHCRIHTARTFLRRGEPGDRDRAEALLADARAQAESMPAPRLVERIDALLS